MSSSNKQDFRTKPFLQWAVSGADGRVGHGSNGSAQRLRHAVTPVGAWPRPCTKGRLRCVELCVGSHTRKQESLPRF
jgi:hypothetical protein